MHIGTAIPSETHLTDHALQSGRCDVRSGLERAVDSVARVRPGQPAVLASVLLGGLPRRRADDTDVLWPLWAAEAVYRAEGLLTLLVWLDRTRARGSCRLGRHLDIHLARSLASQYQVLQSGPARARVPCSPILRDTAAALISLFGEAAGRPVLRTDVARLLLPAFQRRALVLAANALVVGLLNYGVERPRTGFVDLMLRQERQLVRLRMTVQKRVWLAGSALVAAHAMADLLAGELLLENEGRQVDIVFPVPD